MASKPSFVRWAEERNPGDLVRWWRELSARGYRAAAAFAEELAPDGSALPEAVEPIASLLAQVGDEEAAVRAYSALSVKYRAAGAWGTLGWSLMKQGAILRSQGRFDAACESYREAESAFLKAEDDVAAACARADLGVAIFKRGESTRRPEDIVESSRLLRDSLRVLQRAGRTSLLAVAYNALGSALSIQGDVEPARDYLKRAEHLFRAMGQRADVASVFRNRGLLEICAGRLDAAADSFRLAARAYRDLGNMTEAARGEEALAKLLQGRGAPRKGPRRPFFE